MSSAVQYSTSSLIQTSYLIWTLAYPDNKFSRKSRHFHCVHSLQQHRVSIMTRVCCSSNNRLQACNHWLAWKTVFGGDYIQRQSWKEHHQWHQAQLWGDSCLAEEDGHDLQRKTSIYRDTMFKSVGKLHVDKWGCTEEQHTQCSTTEQCTLPR